MKHILVPTDFSDCAANALSVAIHLARHFSASVHLLSCIDIPDNWESLSDEERQALPAVADTISSTNAQLQAVCDSHPDLEITYATCSGKLIEEIQACIEDKTIDFVVMGSHGKSGFSELFIGSNTQKVVRTIPLPVLIIKGDVQSIDFKKVVFASSFNISEREPFLKFKEIVRPFEPEIHLLGIKSSFFFDAPVSAMREAMGNFQLLAEPLKCKKYIFKNRDIENGIRSFSKEIGAELIAISNHNRKPLRRMLSGSTVEALINHSDLPVLSIDYSE
jgi:nucleotide-binding universal stress UspA family protein